jgi:hypothetical protein
MSGQTEATRQSDFITPPRAGQIAAIAVTSTAGSQDLRLCGQQTVSMANANQQAAQATPGLPGHYATFEADGGDIYVLFGPTLASVTGGNVPVIATTGVNAAGACFKIPSGQNIQCKLEVTTDLFIGFITSATATLRIAQSSP